MSGELIEKLVGALETCQLDGSRRNNSGEWFQLYYFDQKVVATAIAEARAALAAPATPEPFGFVYQKQNFSDGLPTYRDWCFAKIKPTRLDCLDVQPVFAASNK